MEGTRHAAVPVQLADVPDVDENDVGAAVQPTGLLDRQRFDLAFSSLDQILDMNRDILWHRRFPIDPRWWQSLRGPRKIAIRENAGLNLHTP